MLRIGSLFSGVGGFELGLEAALDAETVWQVELDPHCREVLAMHWPNANREVIDVHQATTLDSVDLICGGHPCPYVSDAARGRNVGVNLWPAFYAVIQRLRPRFVVVENVDGAAWRRWVPRVRSDLGVAGYSSVPLRVRACDVGAPFRGARVFVVAQAHSEGQSVGALHAQMARLPQLAGTAWQDWGQPSPAALGVADGVPRRMDRLRLTGNAVVPAMAHVVGLFIARLLEHNQPAPEVPNV